MNQIGVQMKHDRLDSDDESDIELDVDTELIPGSSRSDSLAEEEDGNPLPSPTNSPAQSKKPIPWSALPRKDQLAIIALARLSEPLVQTSLQAYMFYQLKWFDPSLPDSTISGQAGFLHASFTGAQFATAMIWGRIADSSHWGRKRVLLICLLGTSLSCFGFAFSTTFWQAFIFRTLAGITNGNVGVLRTMISETIREKKYQQRSFLILPMTYNIGVIIGPIIGGILADAAGTYPSLFGKIDFLIKLPYATPSIASSMFLFFAAVAVWLGLEETHDVMRDGPPDMGIRLGKRLVAYIRKRLGRSPETDGYASLLRDTEMSSTDEPSAPTPTKRYTQRLPFKRIFTRNVLLTLFVHFLLNFHMGTFYSLWFVFLSTPVHNPASSENKTRLPFLFTGGVGMQPQSVGLAMSILGFIGIGMQLFLYPPISARLGTLKSLRTFFLTFPIAYFLVPYLSVVPSTTPPPSAKTGIAIWLAICCVLFIQISGRTFALPCQVILINNASPHPSVLGTVHGIGQSVSSAARTIGPIIGGVVYGFGLNQGIVGLMWWALSCVSVCACFASLIVREGDGHEIWLEGDEEEPIATNR